MGYVPLEFVRACPVLNLHSVVTWCKIPAVADISVKAELFDGAAVKFNIHSPPTVAVLYPSPGATETNTTTPKSFKPQALEHIRGQGYR